MSKAFSISVEIGGKLNPSLGAAVSQAKAQVNNLASSLATIGARINAPFAAVNRHLSETSKRMAAVQRTGRNATLGITTPAAWLGASMIKDANEFAKAGNVMEAWGDITKDQRTAMEKIAQDLARRYDAGGATGIMKVTTELLKAGFTFEQAKGSLEQVLATTALAGDMAAADVGAAISKSLVQFQMPMKTSEQIAASATKMSDRLVYAAGQTVASTREITESFKFAGGIAAATGNSLDQTTAAVMAFAKAGVLGSESGTALRSAIVRLVKMPKEGLAALNRIGMNLGDYTSAQPVSTKGVVASLQPGGIDASKIAPQIGNIIKRDGGKGPAALAASITKAVQDHLGSTSVIDADTIAGSVTDAITAAGSKVDVTKFFTDLKAKLDSGAATMGDIAQILEARHISRYTALLQTDLNALIAQIQREAEGFAAARYKILNQGLPESVLKIDAAYKELRNTLIDAVAPEIVTAFERIGSWMKSLADTSPAILKVGIGAATAAAAAGPLLFVLGAVGRVGLLAMRGLNLAIMALLAPIGLVARGIVGLVTAMAGLAVAGAARLSAMVVGLRMLTAVGAGATLSALAGSFGRLALAPFLLIATGLRAIGAAMLFLVANPVGIIIGALVAALAALGVFVANNWSGIKQFFESFGKVFMSFLDPQAGGAIKSMVDGISSVVKWLGDLLGPLDETGEKWATWGGTLGKTVAEGVNSVINGLQKLLGFFGSMISGAAEVGKAIGSMFSWKSWGGAAAAPAPIAGARALGGPVMRAKPYLVGERGPELFVPGMNGRIETNERLRRLQSDGTAAVAGSTSTTTIMRNNKVEVTVNVQGGNPDDVRRAAEDAVYAALARLESEQSGYLSD